MFGVLDPRERFCEYVGTVVLGGAVRDSNGICEDVLADEVMSYVDVLRARVELMIVGEGYGGHVV